MPGTIGTSDPRRSRPLHEPEVMLVVEEQLRDQEIDAGLDLGRQVVEVARQIPALDVPFGIARRRDGHAIAQPAAQEGDQLGGVGQSVGRRLEVVGAGRRIAPQRDDVANAAFDQAIEDLAQLGAARSDAGEMGHGPDAELALDAGHELDGPLAVRSTGAVGDRDIGRVEIGEVADGPLEVRHPGVGLGGKELEGIDGPRTAEEVADAHGIGVG